MSHYFKAKFPKKSLNNVNLKKMTTLKHFLVLLLLQSFFLKAILCVILRVKCVKKKSEGVTNIWVTAGEESVLFIKFTKFCYFHYHCWPICPTGPPSPLMTLENGSARCQCCGAEAGAARSRNFWPELELVC
jgi:hypothetical protein